MGGVQGGVEPESGLHDSGASAEQVIEHLVHHLDELALDDGAQDIHGLQGQVVAVLAVAVEADDLAEEHRGLAVLGFLLPGGREPGRGVVLGPRQARRPWFRGRGSGVRLTGVAGVEVDQREELALEAGRRLTGGQHQARRFVEEPALVEHLHRLFGHRAAGHKAAGEERAEHHHPLGGAIVLDRLHHDRQRLFRGDDHPGMGHLAIARRELVGRGWSLHRRNLTRAAPGLSALRRPLNFPGVNHAHAPAQPVLTGILVGLLGLGALAVMLLAVPSGLFELDRHAVPKELALHGTALLALPALAWSVTRVRLTIPEYLILAWVVWSGLSAIFAGNHWLAFRGFGVSVSAAVIFWMARRATTGGRRHGVLIVVALGVLVATLTALAQAYGLTHWSFAEARAPGGTLGNRNFAAHLAVIGMPVFLFLALRSSRVVTFLLGLTGMVAATGLVVLTRSRAAWLAGIITLVLLALAHAWSRRGHGWGVAPGRLRTVVLATVLGVAAALALPNALNWRSESPYRDTVSGLVDTQQGSGRGRLIQYRNSLGLVGQSPIFGTGPGNWAVEYPRVTTDGDPSFAGWAPIPTNPWPSSDWVAMLVERGPVGAALLLFAGLSMVLMAARRLRHEQPEAAHLAATLLAVVTATAVCGAFDAVLLLAPPAFIFFTATGALLPDSGPVLEHRLPRRVTILILPVTVGLVTAFTGRSAAQMAAILAAGNGNDVGRVHQASRLDPGNLRLHLIQATRLPCNQARAHARMAMRLYPYHPSVKEAMARCRAGTVT